MKEQTPKQELFNSKSNKSAFDFMSKEQTAKNLDIMDRKERGFLIGLVAGGIFCFNFLFLPIWVNPVLGIIVGAIIGTRLGKKFLQSIKKP